MLAELRTLEAYRLSHSLSCRQLAILMKRRAGVKIPARTLFYTLNLPEHGRSSKDTRTKIKKFLRTLSPAEVRRVVREDRAVRGVWARLARQAEKAERAAA